MDVIFVFILSMKFVSFVQSEENLACVWCAFGGTEMKSGYKFSMSDIPERCNIIGYGSEYFDVAPSAEDTAAITALVAAKKNVYMFFSYSKYDAWQAIMKSKDLSGLDEVIQPMIKFLNDKKVNGVILSYLALLAGEIPGYDTKIATLICKIKAAVPNIKIGLLVSAWMYTAFSNKKVFDFSVTNGLVDVYIIDTTTADSKCTATLTADGGRIPLTTSDKEVISMKDIIDASKGSPMTQEKMIIYFGDYAILQDKDEAMGKSYTEYCKRSGGLWCGDTMQMFYDRAKSAKGTFKGILVSGLDQDDFDNSCGCGKFPVVNTYIDAWQGKPITCCPNI